MALVRGPGELFRPQGKGTLTGTHCGHRKPSFSWCLVGQQPLPDPLATVHSSPTPRLTAAGCPLFRQDSPLGSVPSDILSLGLRKCQSWPDETGMVSHCCPLPARLTLKVAPVFRDPGQEGH